MINRSTLNENHSRSRICQFLGRYSMAMYMLHDPLIKVMIFNFDLIQAGLNIILSLNKLKLWKIRDLFTRVVKKATFMQN